jgi:hypothetical protein
MSLGKEVCKYSFEQLSAAVTTFLAAAPTNQLPHLQGELERIATWLEACPLQFIGSSILLSYDTQAPASALRVHLIDFGHVEPASGPANAGNILGIRTLQRVVQALL